MTVVVPTEPLPPEADPPVATPGPVALAAAAPAPSDTVTRAAWPFPWERPRTPEPGDNQVLSVNTKDGATEYHVAMALSGSGTATTCHSATRRTRTRAATTAARAPPSFQIILVVGYSGVITPVNSAVSANYDCKRCSTSAVAVQLVATLNREPDASTKSALDRIMADLRAKSATFQDQSAEQVYATLMGSPAAGPPAPGHGRRLKLRGDEDGHHDRDRDDGTCCDNPDDDDIRSDRDDPHRNEHHRHDQRPRPHTTETTPTETTQTETTPTETTSTETTPTETTPTEPEPGG